MKCTLLLLLLLITGLGIIDSAATSDQNKLGTVCIGTQSNGNCTCTPYGSDESNIKVDCGERKFLAMPSNIRLPPHVAYLDMRQNEIHNLGKLEKNEELTHLSLAINDLATIDHFAFEQTTNLEWLDLSYNNLKSLPDTLFSGLGLLQKLNLTFNHIEVLPNNLFKSCVHLEELHIGHNQLKLVTADMFAHLSQLQVLDLSHSEIFSLESTTFAAMRSLDTLDLTMNDFDAVPIDALRGARALQSLDLSHNPIREVNEASFYKLTTLKQLTMNHMKRLTEIKRKAFASLSNLEILSLADNPHLSFIDAYAFVGTFNRSWIKLREVSLRRNSLSTLVESTLPFCNLTALDLTENPWRCDCHLHWIKYCEKQHEKTFQHGLICASPDELRGQDLEAIDHKAMKCDNDSPLAQSSVLFTICLFFMGLMFITLIIFIYRDRLAEYYGHNHKQGSIYYVRAQSETE